MSKGSTRRPSQVDPREFADRWDRIFTPRNFTPRSTGERLAALALRGSWDLPPNPKPPKEERA